jgi:hypothetical protein
MMTETCDPRCYELACHFLACEPNPELRSDDAKIHLAMQIQQCIWDEIEAVQAMFPEQNQGCVKPC